MNVLIKNQYITTSKNSIKVQYWNNFTWKKKLTLFFFLGCEFLFNYNDTHKSIFIKLKK